MSVVGFVCLLIDSGRYGPLWPHCSVSLEVLKGEENELPVGGSGKQAAWGRLFLAV